MPDAEAEATVAALDPAVDVAVRQLGDLAERNFPLASMTTYRVGGPASVFVRPRSIDDLAAVAEAHRLSGLPVLIVGRGSNLLIADRGFAGIAVAPAEFTGGICIDTDTATVTAGGGVLLPVLARRTVRESLSGFEWAVGVPGSVGGAVRMNAGGHGSDMAAVLLDVEIADLTSDDPDRMVRTVAADALDLGFRRSGLKAQDLVLSARLQLARGDRAESERTISEIVTWRREHQPGGQNAGSVFVNPVPGEVSAGALVDDLGLRGFRLGTATVSEKHANFIQADENGSADDVLRLMVMVRERVAAATGFDLRTEIRLIGFENVEDD